MNNAAIPARTQIFNIELNPEPRLALDSFRPISTDPLNFAYTLGIRIFV